MFHRACSLFTCHVYQQALPRQPPQHASLNHTCAPHISSHPIISCSHDITLQSRDQRCADFIFGGVNCSVRFFPVLFQYTKYRVSFLSSYLKGQKYLHIIFGAETKIFFCHFIYILIFSSTVYNVANSISLESHCCYSLFSFAIIRGFSVFLT